MKTSLSILFLAAVLLTGSCTKRTNVNLHTDPPSWAKDVIWYQIFVERFNNGDPTNDPTSKTISTPTASFPVPETWQITPWAWDWYEQEPWAKNTGLALRQTLQHRRYGGDLQGVLNKLDYLAGLGITAIYFNPLNDAPSLHKYDARNYHHIDVNFGPDPEGDMQIIASEDPADPATWQWTSADKLFLELVQQCHQRNIKVIIDYSWNHTGVLFWAWQDLIKNQQLSRFKDWYEVLAFDDPATPENEFKYKGWLNIMSLPEFKKIDLTGERVHGIPFEGNLNPQVKQHIFDVTRRWLAPDGDTSKGIDGYRLDVADQIPLGFWRDYRKFVKSINPDALLVGEIWWSHWPDDFMDPTPYTSGDIFDNIMFYHAYRPARGFFAGGEPNINAQTFVQDLDFEWKRLKEPIRYAMMNVNATHDSPRLLTCFANHGKYKYHANPYEDPAYMTGKPDAETFQRVRLYLIHQFTSVGAPYIWNGDEMGMWGSDDPDCRKPLWWREISMNPESRNNVQPGAKTFDKPVFDDAHFSFLQHLIRIRKHEPALISGRFDVIYANGNKLMYKRELNNEKIYAIFNMEKETASFELPETGSYINLLDSLALNGNVVHLKPLSAMLIKMN